MWFLQQLEPDASVYNNVLLIRFEGRLDVAILERGINELVSRHEALRTRFAVVEGVPVQQAVWEFALTLPVVDVPPVAEGNGFAEALRRATEEAGRPFDLAADQPPARVLLAIRHTIYDGESIATLMRELVALYSAFAEGRVSPLEPLPTQYIDAVNKRHRQLSGQRLAAGIDYWKRQLADAPPLLELPLDRPRPPVQSFRGGLHPIVLRRELTGALRVFSRQQGVTLYMTVLAALQVLMYRYSGQQDVLAGTPMTGRTRAELRDMVGYLQRLARSGDTHGRRPAAHWAARLRRCRPKARASVVDTIVLRSRISDGLTVRELLKRVRGTADT